MPSNRPARRASSSTLATAPTILGLLLIASGAIAQAPPSSPPQADTPSTAVAPTMSPAPQNPALQGPAPQNPASEAPPNVVANPIEPQFGDAGEFVVSGLMSASLGHLGYSSSDASTTSVGIQPAIDYFFQRNVSIGGSIFLNYSDATTGFGINTQTVSYGAYGRIGGNVPLGEMVSLRPVLSLGVWSSHRSEGGVASFAGTAIVASGPVTETAVVVELFAPLLVHPARHFFLGFGPDMYTDLTHTVGDFENRRMFVGLSSIVGGWF